MVPDSAEAYTWAGRANDERRMATANHNAGVTRPYKLFKCVTRGFYAGLTVFSVYQSHLVSLAISASSSILFHALSTCFAWVFICPTLNLKVSLPLSLV